MLRKCGAEVCFSLESLSQKCATSYPAYIIGQDGEHSSEFYDSELNISLCKFLHENILSVDRLVQKVSRTHSRCGIHIGLFVAVLDSSMHQ